MCNSENVMAEVTGGQSGFANDYGSVQALRQHGIKFLNEAYGQPGMAKFDLIAYIDKLHSVHTAEEVTKMIMEMMAEIVP
jgi:hypothetical protein